MNKLRWRNQRKSHEIEKKKRNLFKLKKRWINQEWNEEIWHGIKRFKSRDKKGKKKKEISQRNFFRTKNIYIKDSEIHVSWNKRI